MKAILLRGFLALAIMLAVAVPADAGPDAEFEKGLAAYDQSDYATALKFWRPLAKQGFAGAENNLGDIYYNGLGVPRDHAEAVKWYRKAAEQGFAAAQYNLGNMHRKGQGVAQDEAEAVKWYRKAADQGFAGAQNNLGDIYYNGFGVPQDYAEAAKWYRKAADQGDAEGQNKLALMHVTGEGVPQDYVSAQMWFNIAAALGDEKAQKARNMVVNLMTPDQITAAQLLAREWMAETLNSEVRGTGPKEVSRQEKIHDNSQLDTGPKVPGERIGYKFSNMMFGEYCETAFIQLLKASVSGPVAMALGEESCGIGGAGTETVTEAEAEALEKCKSATTGCRIIFTKGAD